MTTEYILNEAMERVLELLTPSNRLVMRVMLHTGLRVGDVLALKPEQLRRRFVVTEHKTGKRKTVTLTDDLLCQLRLLAGEIWVFPMRGDPSRHRTRQAVWADVKRAAKACRMSQNVGTHSARKAYAVELYRKYGDIERVRRALNHSSACVTVLYACADSLTQRGYKRRRKSKG